MAANLSGQDISLLVKLLDEQILKTSAYLAGLDVAPLPISARDHLKDLASSQLSEYLAARRHLVQAITDWNGDAPQEKAGPS